MFRRLENVIYVTDVIFFVSDKYLDAIITTDDNNVNIELCCYIREDLAREFISFRDNLLILTRVFCLPSRSSY